jgi:hypothetical protein
VKKRDNKTTFELTTNRQFNFETKFDTESMGNVDNLMEKLKEYKVFTKFGSTKGFWKEAVEAQSKHVSAFSTTDGYQFKNATWNGLEHI